MVVLGAGRQGRQGNGCGGRGQSDILFVKRCFSAQASGKRQGLQYRVLGRADMVDCWGLGGLQTLREEVGFDPYLLEGCPGTQCFPDPKR